MYVELTNIDSLREAYAKRLILYPDSHFFISDWDSDIPPLEIGDISIGNSDIHSYQFPPFFDNHKRMIWNLFSPSMKKDIHTGNFAILSNGTGAFLLLVLSLLQRQINNWLCISPIYFSHLNVLEELNANISIVSVKPDSTQKFVLDFEMIERTIAASNIQAILVTNPFFGIGQELDHSTMMSLSEMANHYNAHFIVDNIYGGMSWRSHSGSTRFIDERMILLASRAKKYSLIESISKRTLTNGAKTALLFSCPELIDSIEARSLFTTGSLCGTQIELLDLLYSKDNYASIMSYMDALLHEAYSLYQGILTLSGNGSFMLFPCDSGYYALGGFRKSRKMDDMAIAHCILEKTGVLTVPHSRYLFELSDYYCFRINLLGDKSSTIHSLMSIADLELFR